MVQVTLFVMMVKTPQKIGTTSDIDNISLIMTVVVKINIKKKSNNKNKAKTNVFQLLDH